MRWPWSKSETRASATYAEALIAAQVASANAETTARVEATAALETCSGFVSRAFAAAEVQAPETITAALDPSCLALIGRALLRTGQLVLLIDVKDGALSLLPASSCDVYGGPDPRSWRYDITLAGPDKQLTTKSVRADGVVHLRYAFDADAPWRGYGPLQVAKLAGRLSAETVAALADEASGPPRLVPAPPRRRERPDDHRHEKRHPQSERPGARGGVRRLEHGGPDEEHDMAADEVRRRSA